MAIEITARIVVNKTAIEEAGIDSTDDQDIAVTVGEFLSNHLPPNWERDQITVGIRRNVKKDNITNA